MQQYRVYQSSEKTRRIWDTTVVYSMDTGIPSLAKGNRIALFNVSDVPARITADKIEKGLKILKSLGFEAEVVAESLRAHISIEDQAELFMRTYLDEKYAAMICICGGVRCLSLLPHINFEHLRGTAKVLMGSSDCMHLLQAMTSKLGLVTFHGPVVKRLDEWTKLGRKAFIDFVCQQEDIVYHKERAWNVLHKGKCSGRVLVGNDIVTLSMLNVLDDAAYDGGVLFLENHSDADDAMVHYWHSVFAAKGVFEKVNAVIYGDFLTKNKKKTAKNLYEAYLKHLDIPVMQVDFFALRKHLPIPNGALCTVDADKGSITFHHS